jgi:hypothetical protein
LILQATPGCILLVTTDSGLDAIPWEYTYAPNGFLVLEFPYVHGFPAEQCIVPPAFENDWHIVAIPSNPLSHDLEPLNIDREWMRLKESIRALAYVIMLERTHYLSLERVRQIIANQKHRISISWAMVCRMSETLFSSRPCPMPVQARNLELHLLATSQQL